MGWLDTLLALVLWFVGVPVLVFVVLKAVGYEWGKPWLAWRTEARPLPPWVYVVVSAFLGIGVLIAALSH